jgi:chemotaxis protein MotB
MSLLLAFFVLLFSFSEMDKAKYKQVAGSMKEAFGIQRVIKVKEPPKGINIIAQEFSAGTPDPETVRNILRQNT